MRKWLEEEILPGELIRDQPGRIKYSIVNSSIHISQFQCYYQYLFLSKLKKSLECWTKLIKVLFLNVLKLFL